MPLIQMDQRDVVKSFGGPLRMVGAGDSVREVLETGATHEEAAGMTRKAVPSFQYVVEFPAGVLSLDV